MQSLFFILLSLFIPKLQRFNLSITLKQINVDIIKAVGLRNYRDVIFYAEVNVGDLGQSFKMVFDLGSSDLWVPSLL
ncbi:hypothetical protein ARALYDRAFT_894311 [Arabidopsis lyrata subsp. lyrata]|uniref:Peptidase A1 domain-containing protein n=1 Tax=Arabidopsis lyrata subsp. lyrata TaxID=81972 RepID=D7KTS0_ARALL|nr:hypothetical protein ARALYDRAFT_894311 [Arabidopsis lyrata subsp. lyrata]